MKCRQSSFITNFNVNVMFIYKFFAKIQVSIVCCNMETVISIIRFEILSVFIEAKYLSDLYLPIFAEI